MLVYSCPLHVSCYSWYVTSPAYTAAEQLVNYTGLAYVWVANYKGTDWPIQQPFSAAVYVDLFG